MHEAKCTFKYTATCCHQDITPLKRQPENVERSFHILFQSQQSHFISHCILFATIGKSVVESMDFKYKVVFVHILAILCKMIYILPD